MLRTETVERTTLELLKTLMRDEKLSDFTLVGGTNLALQIGHHYSLSDIAAMKLTAISDNGTRLKDFVDIAYLSTKMSFSEMLNNYTTKYPTTNSIRAIKGLSYYDDIDFSEQIDLCCGNKFEWKKIEQRIRDMIKFETKIFEQKPI